MKTAIATEFIIDRGAETFWMELMLSVFPDTEFYCLAHKMGSVQGEIERRRITSSAMSRFASDRESLQKKAWLAPSSLKSLTLAPDIEQVIVISRGFMHAWETPSHVKRFDWITGDDLPELRLSGWQKMFKFYLEGLKNNLKYPSVFASQSLAEKFGKPSASILVPTFRTEEFPFVRDEDHNFVFTHHLVYLPKTPETWFVELVTAAGERKVSLKFLGNDEAFGEFKKLPHCEFVGDHCEATSALYTVQARAVWDFSLEVFPWRLLGGLCCGRPVVGADFAANREFLPEDGRILWRKGQSITQLLEEVEGVYMSAERTKLRRAGLKWNERLFKGRMQALGRGELTSSASGAQAVWPKSAPSA